MIPKVLCVCFISIYLSTRLTLQVSLPASPDYIGAVVEYNPVRSDYKNATEITNENTKNYVTIIKIASENEVDIIVFPENGLLVSGLSLGNRSNYLHHSSYLPRPEELKVPCHDASSNVMEAVKAISCAALHRRIYVVINVREKEKCTGANCSKDGHNLYNTNVVFDREGRLIAKYRKWNLFGEKEMNVTAKPELSTFQTDFGITFGQFICFDILFQTPALKLITEKKITDIVFSSHWFSELPYLTANAVQTGWSYINDVNFLGSGFNEPSTGSGGSGIYSAKNGHLARVWSEKQTNALIITKIPKIKHGSQKRSINPEDTKILYLTPAQISTNPSNGSKTQQVLKMDDTTAYTTQLLQPKNGTFNVTLCNYGHCCNFTTNTEHREDLIKGAAKYYRYRFAVFNGVRSFSDVRTGGVEICSIIACLDDNPTSCSKRFDSNTIIVHPTTFKSIVISSKVQDVPTVLRMPLNINTELHPLNVSDFTFTSDKINATHVNLKYSLIKPRKDLMTFAIYGRNFTADGLPKTVNSSAGLFPHISLLIIMVILGITSAYEISLFPSKF
ncbi:vanin-like protein 2 [Chelonus insularis]|uniref:vanin-like protein 2 n=1 Tax=Chelonus insularis TaxID=460826 RepID=UPI0015883A63|nr:vanin-like protein 2 [Chelonus insularis]